MDGDKGSCMYCGTVVERQASTAERPRFSVTQIRLDAPPPSSYSTFSAPAAPRRGPALALGIVLSTVFVAVGIGLGLLLATRPSAGPRPGDPGSIPTSVVAPSPVAEGPVSGGAPPLAEIGGINEMIMGLPRDGAGEDLLVYVNNPNDQGISVALIDGGSRAARWKSKPLSKDAYRGRFVADVDMLYLTDHERLLALRLSDGALAWEAPLVAEPSCEECLRLAGKHVVVAQKDGSIQGFDARSGQRAWSIDVDDPPRTLPLVGDRLLLMRPVEKSGRLFSLIDPATGKETRRIEPTCPNTSFPDQLERPEEYSPLLFAPDGKTLYTTFGFFSKCAQRWDLASGKRAWQTALDGKDIPESGWEGRKLLLTEAAIYFGYDRPEEGALWAMDTASGKLRKVVAKKKYFFVPVAARDGMIIALTWPNWDQKKQSLVGLDAQTGEQRWEFKPRATDSRVIDTHGHMDWRLTAKGLLLVQVLEDQRQMIVETLDLKTGASAGKQTTPLDGSGSHVFWSALWSNDMAWLDIGSSVYALDLASGTTAYRLN
jgi:outer membrane protein assembly factor BamB